MKIIKKCYNGTEEGFVIEKEVKEFIKAMYGETVKFYENRFCYTYHDFQWMEEVLIPDYKEANFFKVYKNNNQEHIDLEIFF